MTRASVISKLFRVAAVLACALQGSARTLRGRQDNGGASAPAAAASSADISTQLLNYILSAGGLGQQGGRAVQLPGGTTVYFLNPQQYTTPPQQQYIQPTQPPASSPAQQPVAQPTPSPTGQHSPKLYGSDPLDLHNRYRAVHHAQPLTYDTSLESAARQWAQKLAAECAFYHSGPGENLASGFTNWADVMWAWYSEYQQYSYAAPGYSPATGHFTQMVWADSTSLGCATATSSCWEGTIWACHYLPTGNVNAPQYFSDNVFAP